MKAAILPVNTAIYQGVKEDPNTAILRRVLEQAGFSVVLEKAIPKDLDVVKAVAARVVEEDIAELVITIGGIGCQADDCVPEASEEIIDREVPGIAESMRTYMMRTDKSAMLLRGRAGIRKNSVILNLPARTKAMKEVVEYILPEVVRLLEQL